MSLDPAIFRALVANGATPEQLLAVVEAAASVEEARRERKRAGNAERQARYRERHAAGESNDSNALQSVTERDGVTSTPSPASPNENNLTPSTHTPENNKPTRAKPGHRMPENWQPEPLDGALAAAVSRWPPGSIERELARFRDWAASATGPNCKKSDWQAAWRNWLRKAEDEGRYANGQRNGSQQRLAGNGGGGSPSGHGRTVDAMQRAVQLAAGGTH